MPDGETPQVNIGTCSEAGLGRTADTEERYTQQENERRLYATRPLVDSGAPCTTPDYTRSGFKQRSIMSQAHGLVELK